MDLTGGMMARKQTVTGKLYAERYTLQEQIGDGRMSSVYLATDGASDDSQVAVKILNSRHADEVKRETFERETEALRRLRHPNIVRLLDSNWSELDGSFYLVLEHLPSSLDKWLRGETSIQSSQFDEYRVMRQLAEALAHAHSENVIHRDIKPSNILLDKNANPMLTDFGVSKIITHLTIGETLANFWSRGYASPEQLTGEAAKTESDIFSLGAVFYHLLSGQAPPPEGPTPVMVDACKRCTVPVKNVLKKMLDPDPNRRYSRGSELLPAIDVFRRQEVFPRLFLIITKTAIRDVVSSGYASESDHQSVADALIEDLGGREVEGVYVRRERGDNNNIIILGDALRLICTPTETGDALVVKAVHHQYSPRHEAEKNRSMFCQVYWDPVEPNYQSVEKTSNLTDASNDLKDLLEKLHSFENVEIVSSAHQASRRNLIENWDRFLRNERRRIQGKAPELEYTEVIESSDYLRFNLLEPFPDNLNWEDDTPLAVRQNTGSRWIPVGNLLTIRGKVIEVSRQRQRSGKDYSPIPKTGLLTVNITEELVANKRKSDAISTFRNDQMVNPNLGSILVDPSLSTRSPISDLNFFQDFLSDYTKEVVCRAVCSNELFLIQGPPGTGKTSVIAEIVLQILKRNPGSRILLTSQSNVAVDHALSQIAKAAKDSLPEMVRIGRLEKIGSAGERWTAEQRALAFRQEALDKCQPEISKLRAQERKLRRELKASQTIPDFDGDSEGPLEEWIAEAKELAENLNDYESEQSSLGPEASESTKDAMADMVEQTQTALNDLLIALNELLPVPIDIRDMKEEEILNKIIKATAPPRNDDSSLEDPKTRDLRRAQELRKTLSNWTKIVGRGDDFEQLVSMSSRVVAATCQISGRRSRQPSAAKVRFDWAIVDEAGRATVPEVLIPIVRSDRVILVGDERQLPPVVESEDHSLDTSLFQSIVEDVGHSGHDYVANLRTQYRMHPAIGSLISEVFYEGTLENGEIARPQRPAFDWMPAPVTWLSTSSIAKRAETREGTSFANHAEADIILELLKKMEAKCRDLRRRPTVGVICGYSAQVARLTSSIEPDNSVHWRNLQIEVATVDSFQGRECEAIVYSTVRSNPERRIGFLKDRRRINVALSRAQELLVIVGDNHMMDTATIGPDRNPFGEVIDYIILHPDECQIVQHNLLSAL